MLYTLLLVAAVLNVHRLPAVQQAVQDGQQTPAALMIAPALAGALHPFVRGLPLRPGAVPALPRREAFVQVGLMVLVLMLLLPVRSSATTRPRR